MDIIDLSTVATDDASFLDYIDQLCQKLGFDYASYATTSPMTGAVQGYANYPDSWKMHYMRRNLHRVDPTIHKSALSIAPVDWSRFERDERFRAVFFAAEDFGITPQGLTVPVRGPYGDRGLLSVTRNCARPEWEKHKRAVIGELQVAAVHLHDAVMRSDVISRALRQPRLSTREIEVLQWAAAGKSQTDIGDILGISHRTVEVHLRSAREKLGTLSTVQAVGRAIGLGLVYPR
ncbi:LuxR family transcriptional regulator [Rhodobacter sphaeroides]|jgi:DNA-binding HTH domain-containing proteins|uniref:Transcriptional regulator, LuxR family n=2 Tax=Cereibacter sphaeroides TaxID=1063 RepID=Q3J1N8_CERS4|nr:LuxR family transcriptional regulator [Cereibacter sphaeroides]ABN76868.1 Autoinducer-binding domain protein [Cereibacter sphaeroides ATCC 17029]EKX57533.1 Transcriptional activator protein LuxR [Rhodobacter sp. AKP1]AAC46021.1 autoinducer sythesis regulator [Cereibacter sphaeroides]ABA79296.1 transcriptional regulator, LuxR family [Cereibacter sphaeroides 2.4.1]ACM01299.1 Autoinducer-binding domain protein [Cereibacter sphaeroides KD131]